MTLIQKRWVFEEKYNVFTSREVQIKLRRKLSTQFLRGNKLLDHGILVRPLTLNSSHQEVLLSLLISREKQIPRLKS